MKQMIRTTTLMAVTLGLCMAQAANAETREENAARLIAQAENFKTQAAKLHGKAETSINAANRLTGQAHTLLLKVGSPQFKSAVAQYSGDLAQFKEHAELYNAHLADFQKTVGECRAGEAAYDKELKEYQLWKKAKEDVIGDINPLDVVQTRRRYKDMKAGDSLIRQDQAVAASGRVRSASTA